MRAPVVVLFLLSSAAFAQADAGVLTKPPALQQQVEATFPPEALDAGVGATVVMEIDVGADGRVSSARVVQSGGEAFDREALSAVRQFVSPAEVDGVPAAVRLQYSYTFFFKQQVVEVPVAPDAGTAPGTVNFTGTLLERGTRDPISGAAIIVGEGEQVLEAVSDKRGHFEFTDVPTGSQRVVVVNPEHEKYDVREAFEPGKRTDVTYYVRRKVYGAMETVVRSKKERREVAQVTLKQEEIRLIPGTNGDAFKVVQNLPGVARAPFGLGFLVVRGGKPWDTKVFVDEALVPVLFHFGGLFATYNSNLLQDLSFQQGNYNVDFGRGIGGLVRAEGRTPAKTGIHGYADINLIDSSALVEGPIGEKWSFAVSARRSYIDAILPAVLGLIPGATDAIRFTVAPRYYDYQARLEYKGSGSTRFFVSFFGSNDALVAALPNPAIDPEGRGTFGTTIVYNRLLVGFDQKLTSKVAFRTRTSFGFDKLGLTGGSDIFLNSTQYPVLSRNTFTIALLDSLQLSTGIDLYALPYEVDVQAPPTPKLNQIPDPFSSRKLLADHSFVFQFEPAVFAELLWKPLGDTLRISGGARADYDTYMKKGWFDPRLSVLWQATQRLTFKGAVGLYHQPPDYRQGQLSAKFGNPNLQPEGARQYMVGTEAKFTDAISLEVQLYYQDLFNQSRQTLGATSGDTSVAAKDLRYTSTGIGHSYGAEVLLRHALTKNFFGWVSYSLSRAERDFQGGTQFGLSPFDQTHNLVVLASYKLPFDFIVGARVRYTTGPLNTPVTGAIYDANGNYYFPIFGAQSSRRLPAFFQLDVRIDKRFVFKEWMLALYLDVQNVTYRKNVEGVLNSYDYSQEAYLSGLPILPVLGVRAEW